MENTERYVQSLDCSSSQKTADIKSLALSHGPEALLVLVGLMESKDEKVALAAAREILLRATGKPEQGEGDDGTEIVVIREKQSKFD